MAEVAVPAAPNPTATRRYGPVALFAIAAALALVGLPSALNLPQANPNQTLEYAPVPPDNNSVAPPGGIFAGLGLGSSSTIGAGTGSAGQSGLGELGAPPPGQGA